MKTLVLNTLGNEYTEQVKKSLQKSAGLVAKRLRTLKRLRPIKGRFLIWLKLRTLRQTSSPVMNLSLNGFRSWRMILLESAGQVLILFNDVSALTRLAIGYFGGSRDGSLIQSKISLLNDI